MNIIIHLSEYFFKQSETFNLQKLGVKFVKHEDFNDNLSYIQDPSQEDVVYTLKSIKEIEKLIEEYGCVTLYKDYLIIGELK